MKKRQSVSLTLERLGINDSLRQYSTTVSDWEAGPWIRLVHDWWQRMEAAFGLQLATPAVVVANFPGRSISRYRAQRNGFGLKHEVALNRQRLHESPAVFLAGLLRDFLREWQNLQGKPSRGRYHDSSLRAKARELGVHLDRWGRLVKVTSGPFTELLAAQGVDISVFSGPLPEARKPGARGRNKKWTCGCTNIRANVEVELMCKKCGRDFVCTDGSEIEDNANIPMNRRRMLRICETIK